jgi:epoxyqueuosine reductase
VGVASVERMKSGSSLLPSATEMLEFPYALCIGFRLADTIVDSLIDGPTRLYAYHYRTVNRELDSIALRMTEQIQRRGFQACPIPSSQVIDWEKNAGHASHRWAAYHAGLGWYGRNNLIVSPAYGARVRYVTVFTDIPLPCGELLAVDCGDCRACVGACPAGAIAERREDFDLTKCREQLRFYRDKWNIGHHICGLCIKACRGRRRATSTSPSQ